MRYRNPFARVTLERGDADNRPCVNCGQRPAYTWNYATDSGSLDGPLSHLFCSADCLADYHDWPNAERLNFGILPESVAGVEIFQGADYLADWEPEPDEPELEPHGFYYWPCQPGCLPDTCGEPPIGPFATYADAIADAMKDYFADPGID